MVINNQFQTRRLTWNVVVAAVVVANNNYCKPKQNEQGTWVTICNCKGGSYSHEEDE